MFAELHEDLRPHLLGHSLNHPLVEWPLAYPAFYARINRCYEFQLAAVAGSIDYSNQWNCFYPNLAVQDRIDLYIQQSFENSPDIDTLATPESLQFLGQCWNSPDVIAQTSSFFEVLSGHPADHDISAVMTTHEHEGWKQLPQTVTVFRGHRQELLAGSCWYLDENIARAWATLPYNGYLSSGQIKKQYVRAMFDRRGECELILKSEKVTHVETVPQMPVAG
ncbi:MAG: hypothetical protein WBH28_11465 [Fuerstiella sp.]